MNNYLNAIPVACGASLQDVDMRRSGDVESLDRADRSIPMVDCVERGRSFRRSVIGADYGDTRPMDDYARSVEAEFLLMKKLAEDAKWPPDLSQGIVEIDQSWQRVKGQANATKVSVSQLAGENSPLRQSMKQMIAKLQDRLSGSKFSLAWILGGVAVLAAGTATWMHFRRGS